MTELLDVTPNDASRRSQDLPEAIELASRDEIAALQLTRLKWSLQYAYNHVPHYRKAFDDKGVHPADLKELSDLALFPFSSVTRSFGQASVIRLIVR